MEGVAQMRRAAEKAPMQKEAGELCFAGPRERAGSRICSLHIPHLFLARLLTHSSHISRTFLTFLTRSSHISRAFITRFSRVPLMFLMRTRVLRISVFLKRSAHVPHIHIPLACRNAGSSHDPPRSLRIFARVSSFIVPHTYLTHSSRISHMVLIDPSHAPHASLTRFLLVLHAFLTRASNAPHAFPTQFSHTFHSFLTRVLKRSSRVPHSVLTYEYAFLMHTYRTHYSMHLPHTLLS